MTDAEGSAFVLYIGHDRRDPAQFCRGSRRAMALAEGLYDAVSVQDVSKLVERGHPLPAWLNGTPLVVCRRTREVYRGTQAVRALQAEAERQKSGADDGSADADGDDDILEPEVGRGVTVDDAFAPPLDIDLSINDRKVTEADPERYMKRRDANA